MSKRIELYEIALANCESDFDINYVLEHASYDDTLTDDEYTEIYFKAESKIKRGVYKMNSAIFTKGNNLIYKMVNRFVIWETAHNGYFVTDRKQRFVLAYGTLEECLYFVDVRPYGMKLSEMQAKCIATL